MESKIVDEISYLIEAVKNESGKPFDISVWHIVFERNQIMNVDVLPTHLPYQDGKI